MVRPRRGSPLGPADCRLEFVSAPREGLRELVEQLPTGRCRTPWRRSGAACGRACPDRIVRVAAGVVRLRRGLSIGICERAEDIHCADLALGTGP